MSSMEITREAWYALAGLVVGLLAGRTLLPTRGAAAPRKSGGGQKSAMASGVELYVGNLAYDATEAELKKTFGQCGRVVSVRLIDNRITGKPKGFAFIEMGAKEEADAAIRTLNGAKIKGRAVVVSEAKSRPRR